MMPFENTSSVPGIDWIAESFPEVLENRLSAMPLFIVSREDRLSAADRLGLPATAKPSRATIYEIAQRLDADYVLVGSYTFDGSAFAAHAQVMDLRRLRLGPEFTESGKLTDLVTIQTALAWDLLSALGLADQPASTANPASASSPASLSSAPSSSKDRFVAQFPPVRLDALENYIRGIVAANTQEKIKRFKEAIRLEPSHTLAMMQLSKTYIQTRDYESAIPWLTRIPATDRNANEAHFYLGLAEFYTGQMEKAEAAFHWLAARLPLSEIYNNLGVTAAKQGEKRARTYFEKIVQNDPNDADYRVNLAIELYREGDATQTIRQLRESLALHPDDAEARAFLDDVSAGANDKARVPAQRIKRNYDESGFRQIALEVEKASEAHMEKTDAATHVALHLQRARQLAEQGLTAEAEIQYKKAAELDPSNSEAHTGLALLLESNHDNGAARNEAMKALRLKPSAEAYLVLARLDLAGNNRDSAAQNVDHALALDPANAAAASLKHDIETTGRQP